MALSDLLERPVLEVAPRLLGATLTHGGVTVRLTEVEAYDGGNDPGSHAYRGETRRNAVMFGPAGRLYVYFTYGMHHCCNVVCGPEGTANAVLLRAGEVVDGLDEARARRGRSSDRDLARGPGRLCQALGIDLVGQRAGPRRPPRADHPGDARQHRSARRAAAGGRPAVAVLDHRRPDRQPVRAGEAASAVTAPAVPRMGGWSAPDKQAWPRSTAP